MLQRQCYCGTLGTWWILFGTGTTDQQTIHDGSELLNRMLGSLWSLWWYLFIFLCVLYGAMQPEPPSANGVRTFLYECVGVFVQHASSERNMRKRVRRRSYMLVHINRKSNNI